MKSKVKALGCSMLALLGIVVVLAAHDPWPAKEAMDAAITHAEGEGFRVGGDSVFAQFVTEPNAYGGCEVEVWLDTVVMRLRRSWRFGEWQVIDLKKKVTESETLLD